MKPLKFVKYHYFNAPKLLFGLITTLTYDSLNAMFIKSSIIF